MGAVDGVGGADVHLRVVALSDPEVAAPRLAELEDAVVLAVRRCRRVAAFAPGDVVGLAVVLREDAADVLPDVELVACPPGDGWRRRCER